MYGTVSSMGCICHRRDVKKCLKDARDRYKADFQTDIDDLLSAVRKVMRICGIPPQLCLDASDAIQHSMLHYDELVYRIDRVPRKRFNKENLLHMLGHSVKMDRINAQITYSIVKRAFNAFYYGTGHKGIRKKSYNSKLNHRSECAWRHAAIRTAQVFAAYAGLMYTDQLEYEKRICCAYKLLFDRLKKRINYDDDLECQCRGPLPSAMSSGTDISIVTMSSVTRILYKWRSRTTVSGFKHLDSASKITVNIVKEDYEKFSELTKVETVLAPITLKSDSSMTNKSQKKPEKKKKHVSKMKRRKRKKCSCPPFECLQGFDNEVPEISAECSQGPYVCRWLPVGSEDEEVPDHPVPREPFVCPPCRASDSSSYDGDDECICEEICICEDLSQSELEAEEDLKYEDEGIEDKDSQEFYFVAPLDDYPDREKTKSIAAPVMEITEQEEAVSAESKPHICRCTCEFKKVLKPEDFNYVAPLSDYHKEPQPEEEEEEEEKAKQEVQVERIIPIFPLYISPAARRCYQKEFYEQETSSGSSLSTATTSHTAVSNRSKPSIKLLAQSTKLNSGKLPKKDSITLDVTVKNQHGTDTAAVSQDIKTMNKPNGGNQPTQKQGTQATGQAGAQSSGVKTTTGHPANAATAKPPATAGTARTPAPPATSGQQQSAQSNEPALTKDDILDIIGLK